MKKKDILELKKRLKKDQATFTRLCGCFVNTDKNVILELKETFLNLEEDDYFKYLEIAKKVLSGTLGNNILQLDFPEGEIGQKQTFLTELKKSKLKDDEIINELYQSIIDNYDFTGNYLILLFHDVYDIITKTTDNIKIDESEEVYEYVLCALCPVSLSAPGLSYYEEENMIKSRTRDWIVGPPINGFIYPAFIDRSPDVNSIMYYTKNAKDTHPELMEDILGCPPKDSSAIQKEKFQYIVKDSIVADEEEVDELYMNIQENLNSIVEEHKSIADDMDENPIKLTKDELKNVLIDSGVTEEYTSRIEKYYEDEFTDEVPLVENLIDGKILMVNELRKNERNLEKQVEFLKKKIEELNPENIDYDIVLHIRPEKIDEIKRQTLDGQEYLLIPVGEDEQTRIQEIK